MAGAGEIPGAHGALAGHCFGLDGTGAMLTRLRNWLSSLFYLDDPTELGPPHQVIRAQGTLTITCDCGRRYVVKEDGRGQG